MSLITRLKNYYDLSYSEETITPQATVTKKFIFLQYIAITLGIIVQPFLEDYIQTNNWHVSIGSLIDRVFFALIVAAIIFPGVYKNAWDKNNPIVIQFCTIFSAGLGWQTLFSAAGQAIHH